MNIFMSAQEEFEMLDEKDKANHMGVEAEKALTLYLIMFTSILTNLN